jgi:hypothetical protein
MPSLSIAARTTLLLVVAGAALLQACGGRAQKGANPSGDDSPPTLNQPSPDATAGFGGAAAEASPVPRSMWPLPASSCASSEWETCTSLGGEVEGYFLAVDAEDHFFIAGSAHLSPPDQTRTVFVAKFSSELELLWFQPVDSVPSRLGPQIQSLAVDATGNSFVVTRSSYDQPSTIAKLSSDGALAWTRPCPGEVLAGVGLAVDGKGELVVADSDKATVRMAKYSTDGDQLWEQERPAEQREIVNRVAADAHGNSWLAADRWLDNGQAWQAGNLEKHGPNGGLEWKISLEAALVRDMLSTDAGEITVLAAIPSVLLLRVSADGDVLSRTDLPRFTLGYGLGSDLDGNSWVTGYTDQAPIMSTVTRVSPEGDVLFSKDFDVPTFFGASFVAQTSSGKVFIIGARDYQTEALVIAQLQP